MNLDKSKIMFRQTTYLKKILEQFYMQDCKPIFTFIEPKIGNVFLLFEE